MTREFLVLDFSPYYQTSLERSPYSLDTAEFIRVSQGSPSLIPLISGDSSRVLATEIITTPNPCSFLRQILQFLCPSFLSDIVL